MWCTCARSSSSEPSAPSRCEVPDAFGEIAGALEALKPGLERATNRSAAREEPVRLVESMSDPGEPTAGRRVLDSRHEDDGGHLSGRCRCVARFACLLRSHSSEPDIPRLLARRRADAGRLPRRGRRVVSERMLQRLVNFGTVSLARVLGNPPDELLTLRCECGARGCSARVEATATEHHDDGCCLFMVACGHEAGVPGRVTVSNERFVKVQVAGPPAAAPTRV
jgi:hypothetical protein